jgi:hypothetical protein
LDVWNHDGRCRNGGDDINPLDFEPSDEFLEKDFSHNERRKITDFIKEK